MRKICTLKNCLFGFAILFLQISFAQKTIQGTVSDENGIAVMGANVWISGTTIGTATLLDGSYQLEISENYFEIDLETSYLGFQKNKISINLDEWDSKNKKDFILRRKNIELAEVVVITPKTKNVTHIISCGGNIFPEDILRCDTPENCNGNEEKEDLGKAIIQVLPNPFVSFIKVQIEVEQEEEQACFFQLFGIDGKFIFAERHTLKMGKEVVRLDVPNLPVGSYILRIEQDGKMIQSDILIKASGK